MPRAVTDVEVRYLKPGRLEEYQREMKLEEYLYQPSPTGLPRLIEPDYVLTEFHEWADRLFAENGFDPESVNLRYAAIDVTLDPIQETGRQMSFPFMINSAFNYMNLNIHGPFVAGHQAGLSMVQTLSEVKYARFFLPPKFDGVFNSDFQTSIIARSIHGIIANERVDGLIAALPDRGRDPDSYLKSNIARLLTGGHITDAAHDRAPFSTCDHNPLRGRPYKIARWAFPTRELPLYSNDFTYYSFLREELQSELLRDPDFIRLSDLIRRLGPMFKADMPHLSEGLLFNPSQNMTFITGLLSLSMR